MGKMAEPTLQRLKDFCDKNVFQAATKPLKDGVAIAAYVDHAGPVTLLRKNGRTLVVDEAPEKPDITVEIPDKALEQLQTQTTEDVGEIGVELLKLMAHNDPVYRIRVKVHIGLLDFMFHGYFGILPLGGPNVMKFLAEKGFGSIGKIKEAINSLRASR